MIYPPTLRSLIEALSRLPGIGSRSAERIALHILHIEDAEIEELVRLIKVLKPSIRYCSCCGNFSEQDLCHICTGANRDRQIVCVVEAPRDIIAIERSRGFNGVYHVLFGVLSPMDDVGPDALRIAQLIERIKKDGIQEVIIATNPNTEGEMTALYLTKVLRPMGLKLSRIASGIPLGSSLEYIDQATIERAMRMRQALS